MTKVRLSVGGRNTEMRIVMVDIVANPVVLGWVWCPITAFLREAVGIDPETGVNTQGVNWPEERFLFSGPELCSPWPKFQRDPLCARREALGRPRGPREKSWESHRSVM